LIFVKEIEVETKRSAATGRIDAEGFPMPCTGAQTAAARERDRARGALAGAAGGAVFARRPVQSGFNGDFPGYRS